MNQLRIAVCEDEQADQLIISTLISSCGIPCDITYFTQGDHLLSKYQPGMYDLILMDIYLGELSGVETVRRIRMIDQNVLIAFETSSLEHALDGYRLNVLKYLEKPLCQKDISDLLQTVLLHRETQKNSSFRIEAGSSTVKTESLLFIEQRGHNLQFHMEDNKILQCKGRLDEIEIQLNTYHFFRCHKSYLVNLSYITGIDSELRIFRMKNNENVYIRRNDFIKAKKKWEDYLINQTQTGGMPSWNH